MLLFSALALTVASVVLHYSLSAHRSPGSHILMRHEVLRPEHYDATGKRLLWPTVLTTAAAAICWALLATR